MWGVGRREDRELEVERSREKESPLGILSNSYFQRTFIGSGKNTCCTCS